MFARFALAGGAIAPPIPTITYGSITNSGTQVTATITNFSSEFGYVATSNVGTLSRVGANITVTGLTTGSSINIVVIATSAKGLSTPSSAVTDRQPYTFRTETRTGTRFVDTTSCYTASPTSPQCAFGGTLNVAGTECCIPSGFTEEFTFTVQIRNDAPAGYLDSGFDWYRVGNVTIERTPYTFTTVQESFTFSCQVPSTCCRQEVQCENIQNCSANTCTVCGDGCANSGTPSGCACPPGWSCVGCNFAAGGIFFGGVCCITVTQADICGQTCISRPSCREVTICDPCTVTSTCTGTRDVTVRNPIPPGYLDSGVDWYRFL
jgi:hypothetical protein